MPVSKTHERTDITAYFLHPRRKVSTVYRVRIPLACSQCQTMMQVGELFSKQRAKLYYDAHAEFPWCRNCSPFQEKVSQQPSQPFDATQPKLFE